MGLWCLCGHAAAQEFVFAESELAEGAGEEEPDEIETDRDSFTPAKMTVGRGRFVVEAAHSFVDNRNVYDTHSFPELVTRYGLTDWLEVRLGWNYEVGGAGSPVSGNIPDDLEENALERESRLLFGLKATLSRQDVWLPASALIVQGFTPTKGEEHDTLLSATYVFGWKLDNGCDWDTAIRYGTGSTEGDQFDTWTPSTVLRVPLGERWKVHVEYFGVFSNNRADETVQHFLSMGPHFLITPDLEVGVRVGWGLNAEAPNFFSNAGFGWRW